MEFYTFLIIIYVLIVLVGALLGRAIFEKRRKARKKYYNEYLKSEAWKRKRYVVLKRDNWTCQECGVPATQVHHKKYAKYKIGKEPIKWLVSLCADCHKKEHS